MRTPFGWPGLLLVAGLVGVPGRADATVARALDREALVRGSDAIVAGSVVSVRAEPGPEGGPEVLTRVEIEVWQTFKPLPGGAPARLTLLQTGGSLDGRTLLVHGQARFATGEQVLVFVERVHDGRLIPYGMSQGKFTLVARDGRTVAVRDLSELALVTPGRDGAPTIRSGAEVVPSELDLGDLERLIARLSALRPAAPEPAGVR